MKKYKDFLLITDLDGTLVGSNNLISQKNRAAAAYFNEQGGSFAIATGRTQENGRRFVGDLAVNMPCIFYNGSVLYDWHKQEFLQVRTLDGRIWRQFVKQCLTTSPTCCLEIYTKETFYIVSDPGNDDVRLQTEGHAFERADLAAVADKTWLKILLCDRPEELLKLRALGESCGLGALSNNFFSAPDYLEFVGRAVSKGNMLQEIRRLPLYQDKFVIAAGDFPNDIDMLKFADCGVAPANAEASTKAAADIVAVSCDEHLIDHIIYKIMPKFF